MAFKSKLLRQKLKEEGRTRRFLAELTGKTERTVSRWLNNGNAPKAADLEKIAEALSCRPQDFDPRFADEGPGIPMSVRISPASRNAFELLRLRYGVTHRQVVEIAPVLFSIAAARALKIPSEDLQLDREAARLGHRSPLFEHSLETTTGFRLDELASEAGKCFGEESYDPHDATPRNLFFQAIIRMWGEVEDFADTVVPGTADPGEAVSATGFLIEAALAASLTGDDRELMEALANGTIRLSGLGDDHRKSTGSDYGSIARELRAELEAVKARRKRENEAIRKESMQKLEAWKAFYRKSHPDLADEYDRLVSLHCHEEGWAPAEYGEEFREMVRARPYHEQRFVDEDTLPASKDKKAGATFGLSFRDPVARRLRELEAHRRKLKSVFEESGQ